MVQAIGTTGRLTTSTGSMITDGQSVNIEMEVVNCYWLSCRLGPGVSSYGQNPDKTAIQRGTRVTATYEKNGWYKHEYGWSSGKYLKAISGSDPYTASSQPDAGPNETESDKLTDIEEHNQMTDDNVRDGNVFESFEFGGGGGSSDTPDNLLGIGGAPFHYTEEVDPPLYKGDLGYYYTKNTLNDLALLLITPGKAEFLQGLSKDSKDGLKQMIIDDDFTNLSEVLGGKNARYYEFRYEVIEYFEYVNALCKLSASYLGIGAERVAGKQLRDFDWKDSYNKELTKLDIRNNNIPFFIDADGTSISDSFSNQTGESILEDKMDTVSDLAKEFQFLFNTASGKDIDAAMEQKYNDKLNDLDTILKGNPNSIFSKLKTSSQIFASGGSLAFPKMWKASEKSESYDIKIKFSSPYGSKLSIFLHVFVPFFHLLALVAPRSLTNNGITTPPMVRAYCRGWFNCDMGMFESMSVSKGEQGWTKDGLPLDIEVSLSLRNMYDAFALSKAENGFTLINNVSLIDFLGTMSGINVNKPELRRKLDAYGTIFSDIPKAKLQNPFEKVRESIQWNIDRMFRQ